MMTEQVNILTELLHILKICFYFWAIYLEWDSTTTTLCCVFFSVGKNAKAYLLIVMS